MRTHWGKEKNPKLRNQDRAHEDKTKTIRRQGFKKE